MSFPHHHLLWMGAVSFPHHHLLGIEPLAAAEIQTILDTAEALREILDRPIKKVPALRGKTVVNLFYEASDPHPVLLRDRRARAVRRLAVDRDGRLERDEGRDAPRHREEPRGHEPGPMVATVVAATLQSGWNVAPEALKPNWSRLSPQSGLQRLSPGRAGVELVKTLVAAVAISWLAVRIIQATVDGAVYFGRVDPTSAAKLGWDQVERLLQQAAVVLAVLAGADYAVQRWRLAKSLRMTKQEVRDDTRLTEGSPEVKARLRRLQRDLLRRRMLSSVPKATVVITNPTGYAVALEYRRDVMATPMVVAKGRGVLAARIKAIARECGVPIVENVPLAQALYKSVEVGEAIPGQLFGAVAEVLAYLIRLKQLVL